MDGICGVLVPHDTSPPALATLTSAMAHRGLTQSAVAGRFAVAASDVAESAHFLVALAGWCEHDGQVMAARRLADQLEAGRQAVDLCRQLRGEFIVAIWDRRSESFTLLRDPMGIRAIYYHDGDFFAFASEQLPLLGLNGIPSSIDEQRVCDYFLHYEYADFSTTLLTAVRRLAPGHWLRRDGAGRTSTGIAWQPELNAVTISDPLAQLTERLESAVGKRIRPGSGVLLSGGLDSALVAHAAQRADPDCRLVAARDPDPEPGCDTHAIATFAAHTNGQPLYAERGELADSADLLLADFERLDDPFPASNTMLMLLMNRSRQAGHANLLDGVEGDLVFSLGREYLATLVRTGQFRRLAREFRGRHHHFHTPWGLDELIAMRTAATSDRVRRWRLTRALSNHFDAQFDDSMLSEHLREAARERVGTILAPVTGRLDSPERLHLAQLQRPYIAVATERYEHTAAVAGVDIHHPLLDTSLVEFALSLPVTFKRRDGWSKWLLRQLGDRCLPAGLAWRKEKPHLGGSFTYELVLQLVPTIRAFLDVNQAWQQYLDRDRVMRLPDRVTSEPLAAERLWYVYTFARWLQRVHQPKQNPLAKDC